VEAPDSQEERDGDGTTRDHHGAGELGRPVSNADNLLAIFTIHKLRDLKKHCRDSTVNQSDLADFIMWCRSSANAPFLHAAHHRHFVPEHLTLSDSDLAALAAKGVGRFTPAAQKTANKIYATFEERRMLSGHLFGTSEHGIFSILIITIKPSTKKIGLVDPIFIY
jgi:hypothetical protein